MRHARGADGGTVESAALNGSVSAAGDVDARAGERDVLRRCSRGEDARHAAVNPVERERVPRPRRHPHTIAAVGCEDDVVRGERWLEDAHEARWAGVAQVEHCDSRR